MTNQDWRKVGVVEDLRKKALQELIFDKKKVALTYIDGQFYAVSGVCNHAAGPLGQGHLEGEYIVCPWHQWKFSCKTGKGEPGFEEDQVPQYQLKVEGPDLYIDLLSGSPRKKSPMRRTR